MRTISNRVLYLLTFLLVLIVLCSCTANVSNTDDNGLKPHLSVDLQVPPNIETNEATTLTISVQKENQPFEQANEAQFIIWLEENPEDKIAIPAIQHSPGVYKAQYIFSSEGLYIIQSHVIASDMEVIPSKRIAIGMDAIKHLAHLEQQEDNKPEAPTGHSHH